MEVLNGPHKGRHIVSQNQKFVHMDRIDPGFIHKTLHVDSIVFRDRHQVVESDGVKYLLYNGTKVVG
jgi:hypothetical protein